METKPFKPNQTKKMEHLQEAADHLFQAIKAFEAAQTHSDHWADYETIGYFKHDLNEFMSCDAGEAGLAIHVLKASREHFSDNRTPVDELKKMIARHKKTK